MYREAFGLLLLRNRPAFASDPRTLALLLAINGAFEDNGDGFECIDATTFQDAVLAVFPLPDGPDSVR